MGYVRTKITVGNAKKTIVRNVDLLADSGAWFTTIPPKLAEDLGIEPMARTRVTLADKRGVEVGVSLAYFKVFDREAVLQVAIMDVPEPLLGVETLEALGLKVDPTTGKLEPTRPYALLL